jgi:hypothetical protein
MPYPGTQASWPVYPYLTAVEDPTLTRNTLVIRDGTLGLRRVLDSGFEYGLLGRVETLGFGTDRAPELAAFDAPAWTLEVGPSIGWRGLAVQPDLSIFKGVYGGHSGLSGQFSLSVPIDLERGYLVPYVAAVRYDDDFVSYYYDIPPLVDAPSPAAYAASDATNFRVGARFGYRIGDYWVLTASAALEMLDDAITDSPLVDEDHLLRASVGIAYNRSIFRQSNPDALVLADDTRLEVALMAMHVGVDSDLTLPNPDAATSTSTSLESDLRLDDSATMLRLDVLARLGRRHRLEFGYTELERSASVIVTRDIQLGDLLLPAGEPAAVRYRSRFLRTSYGYSFLRDDQKEFGVLLGIHWPSLDARISNSAGDYLENGSARSPAPSFGVYARAALRGNFTARARIDTVYAEFDRFSGRLFDLVAALDWDPRPGLGLSLGYTIHHLRLTAQDEAFVGTSRQRYSGPFIGFRVAF